MEIIKLANGTLGEFFPIKEKELWCRKRNVYTCKASGDYKVEIKSNKQSENLLLYYKQEKIFKLNAKTFYFVHFLGGTPYLLASFLKRIHDEYATVVLISLNSSTITQLDKFRLGNCGFPNILGALKIRNQFFVAFKEKLNSLGDFIILRRNNEIIANSEIGVAKAILKFLTSCKRFEDKLNLSEELSDHTITSKDILVLLEILGNDRYWALEYFPSLLKADLNLDSAIVRKIEMAILKQENSKQKARAIRKLGEFYLKKGEKQKAIKLFEKALSIDPNVGVKKLLSKLKE